MFRHPRARSTSMSLLAVAVLMVIASAPTMAATRLVESTASAPAPLKTGCGSPPPLDGTRFPGLPVVDNRFFPLVPGTEYVLNGSVAGRNHREVFTVTDLTKEIEGVRTVVVYDRDLQGDQVQESEIALMAQDNSGTVWNLGEYPEEYTKGKLTGAPDTWMPGVARARAGLGMLATPTLGIPGYSQGVSPGIGFNDCARVFAVGQRTCVPLACYDNVLVTDEWDPGDPQGGHQRKFYAPGVGLVRVEPVGGTDPEILLLAGLTHLCPDVLAQLRDEVLKQDGRGYQMAAAVWSHALPATPIAGSTYSGPPSCRPASKPALDPPSSGVEGTASSQVPTPDTGVELPLVPFGILMLLGIGGTTVRMAGHRARGYGGRGRAQRSSKRITRS